MVANRYDSFMPIKQPRSISNNQSKPFKKSAEAVVPAYQKAQGRAELVKLNPHYIIGFIDGEGCFCVSASKHKTLRRRKEIRPQFEIELRIDDQEILERIQATLGCGNIYTLNYKRYDWAPHVKFKVTRIRDLTEVIIPFIDTFPLQAKKAQVYALWRTVVLMVRNKEHLTPEGYIKILQLRDAMRRFSKKHYRNR